MAQKLSVVGPDRAKRQAVKEIAVMSLSRMVCAACILPFRRVTVVRSPSVIRPAAWARTAQPSATGIFGMGVRGSNAMMVSPYALMGYEDNDTCLCRTFTVHLRK